MQAGYIVGHRCSTYLRYDLHTVFGGAWYFLRCVQKISKQNICMSLDWVSTEKCLGSAFTSSATLGSSDSEGGSKVLGINSVCRHHVNREHWCCPSPS